MSEIVIRDRGNRRVIWDTENAMLHLTNTALHDYVCAGLDVDEKESLVRALARELGLEVVENNGEWHKEADACGKHYCPGCANNETDYCEPCLNTGNGKCYFTPAAPEGERGKEE